MAVTHGCPGPSGRLWETSHSEPRARWGLHTTSIENREQNAGHCSDTRSYFSLTAPCVSLGHLPGVLAVCSQAEQHLAQRQSVQAVPTASSHRPKAQAAGHAHDPLCLPHLPVRRGGREAYLSFRRLS